MCSPLQRRRYRFPHGVLLRIKFCRPEGMVSAIPEIRTKSFCHLIQIPAKQPVLLRILIYATNTENHFAVSLLQPMGTNIIRNNLILPL